MKMLLEYAELGSFNSMLKDLQQLEEAVSDVIANAKSQQAISARRAANSNSKVTQFPVEELNHKMGEAIKRLEAAYRGLGLTNKLTDPEAKLNNRSRIMSNIHKIRSILKDVEVKLSGENQEVVANPDPNLQSGQPPVAESTFKHNLDADDSQTAREVLVKNTKPTEDSLRSRVTKAVKAKFKKKIAESGAFQMDLDDEDIKTAREAVVNNTHIIPGAKTKKVTDAKTAKKKVSEAFDEPVTIDPKKKGMFKGKNKADLETELAALKKSGPHKKGSPEYTKEKELNFAIRAKSDWK